MIVRGKNGELKEIIYNTTQLYNYGLNRLSEREYLRKELRTKMLRLQPDTEQVDGVLDKLEASGLLSDKRAISMYLSQYSGKESTNKTKQRLKQKGADTSLVDDVIEQFNADRWHDEGNELSMSQQDAYVLLERKFKVFDKDKQDKYVRFLVSKGYPYNDIKHVISAFKAKEV